ncbi:hypothetical protein A3Q56_05769 [Intoshia linei]|uniref:Uncharacterized protein n=1 Tax=Intoshia linei TaxID=1819745 RepID=A0A177AWV6_9BILA|nr:hypothetical protein A3Q56_05769 [Intoshia linei]
MNNCKEIDANSPIDDEKMTHFAQNIQEVLILENLNENDKNSATSFDLKNCDSLSFDISNPIITYPTSCLVVDNDLEAISQGFKLLNTNKSLNILNKSNYQKWERCQSEMNLENIYSQKRYQHFKKRYIRPSIAEDNTQYWNIPQAVSNESVEYE